MHALAQKFEVRSLAARDIAAFERWFHDALPRNFADFPPDALRYYAAQWNESRLAGDGPAIAAYVNGIVAGCCLGTPVEGGVGTIIWLFTDTVYRKTGIAGNIFEQTLAAYKAKGAHKVKLTAHNQNAVAFYNHMGMKTEGFHPRHWWDMDFWSLGMTL